MLVAHLSDLHTEKPGTLAYGVADANPMLTAAVDHLLTLKQVPDCVVVSGDLTSSAEPEAYAFVRQELDRLPMPVYVIPGNHDKRKTLLEHLTPYCPADPEIVPHLCYTVEDGPMRLVLLDTTKPGSHSGHLDNRVLEWLMVVLSQRPAQPTLLFMHHPPFLSGMGRMDQHFENQAKFAYIMHRNRQVRLCTGHLHRAVSTLWEGLLCTGAPATSMQLELDISPHGGDMFMMEAPGYLLHHFTEYGNITSHTCQIPSQPTYSGPHPFKGAVNPE